MSRLSVQTRERLRQAIAPAISAVFVILFSICLVNLSQDRHPLSVIDEHIHFDTAVKASQGEVPWRGAILGQELIDEWTCGVSHEAGAMPYPCGDPRVTADAIPSGKYTTGYIHYPTYFFAAAAFQPFWQAITGNADLLDGFRAFSAVLMIAGLIACGAMAWLLGLRGSRLVAATSLPVAAAILVFGGTVVNPASASILLGALIAGTGLLWVRRGRGFVWFAVSAALAAVVSVTASLPIGGFMIAMLVVLVTRLTGRDVGGIWRPKWWQLIVTGLIVVVPVVIWGRVTAATATVDNDVLYGFIAPASRQDVIVGAVRELTALHSPWSGGSGIYQGPVTFVPRLLHAFSQGIPLWITVVIFGAIVIVAIEQLVLKSRLSEDLGATFDEVAPDLRATRLLTIVAASIVATIVLYPPALRISNWLNFGFDYGIVERYSAAFSAGLVFVVLLVIRLRGVPTTLAVIGVTSALGVVAGGW